MSRKIRVVVKGVVWVVALLPVAMLLYRFQTDDLGANPIDFVTDTLGDWTLRLLLASLALTPIRLVTGMAWQMSLRRLLGLFAFSYALLHFSVWVVLDHFFDWTSMGADIVKRPYITVGMTALVCLLPLAATSTTWAIKRMGARNWQRLHRLVYAIAILGVLHYLWLAKVGVPGPYIYGAILAVLLAVRAWDWGRRALRRRRNLGAARRADLVSRVRGSTGASIGAPDPDRRRRS